MSVYDEVRAWGRDRGLIPGNPAKQMLKAVEELGEFLEQYSDSGEYFNVQASAKELGDFLVTLIILAAQHGLDLESIEQVNQIESYGKAGLTIRLGKIAACLSKHYDHELRQALSEMRLFVDCCSVNWLYVTSERCLQLAYDSIRDRAGETINGVFVKTEDLPNASTDSLLHLVKNAQREYRETNGYEAACIQMDRGTLNAFLTDEATLAMYRAQQGLALEKMPSALTFNQLDSVFRALSFPPIETIESGSINIDGFFVKASDYI